MLNREVNAMYNALRHLSTVPGSPTFAYACARNMRVLEPIVQALQQAQAPDAELWPVIEFIQNCVIELRPTVKTDAALEQAVKQRVLDKYGAATVTAINKRNNAIAELMNKVADPAPALTTIPPGALPVSITPEAVNGIWSMIAEPQAEVD